MQYQQAEQLLRQEIASGSATGQALLVLLERAEIENYRVSTKTTDPYALARICGRGEGIHSILNRITPVQDAAPSGLPTGPAGEIR